MVFTTVLTNFALLPTIYYLFLKGKNLQMHILGFTFVASFMYHFTESIGADVLLMSENNWHVIGIARNDLNVSHKFMNKMEQKVAEPQLVFCCCCAYLNFSHIVEAEHFP